MSTKNIIIWLIVGVLVLGGIYVLDNKFGITDDALGTQNIETDSGIKTYSSPEYKVSFDYTSSYILLDREVGTLETPQKAIVIVEDTERNRDILEGRVAEVGDGPTAITIDVFSNPTNLTAEAWVEANTNWIMTGKTKESVTIGGKTGFTYFWDGLYAGKSSVITSGAYTYVFSVTWVTPEDQMVKDFENILSSVKFAN